MRLLVLAAALWCATDSAVGQEAVPTAPPAPFMIFFDWGKPDLRSDDAATLDQVAAAYRTRPAAHLRIAGHTDRSGRTAFNRRAGLRRAAMVRDELERRGIPRNAMSIASFGEERPLVPTEDGVREVQNRRVVIGFEE